MRGDAVELFPAVVSFGNVISQHHRKGSLEAVKIIRGVAEKGYRSLHHTTGIRQPIPGRLSEVGSKFSRGERRRRPLIGPCLGERLAVQPQIKPQIDRFRACVGRPDIEHCAVSLDVLLWASGGDLDDAARGGNDRLDLCVPG